MAKTYEEEIKEIDKQLALAEPGSQEEATLLRTRSWLVRRSHLNTQDHMQ